ncbi:MAG: lysophospholipid acyltransferase family protein [Thermoguttaceae bacterium]
MGTLDCKIIYHDRAIDPIFPECHGQKIYVFWHEYILLPLYLRGHCNLAMLLSRHHDADLLSHAARHLGFDLVRGSTKRGGVAALRAMLAMSQNSHLTVTPDGPRGPRRRLAPGCVYLASKQGLPLVVMGFGYDRPCRIRTAWDQFAIPRCYSRARAVTSGEIYMPPNLSRHDLEQCRQRIERMLNRLTAEAETWAESGCRISGQQNFERHGSPLHGVRKDDGHNTLTNPFPVAVSDTPLRIDREIVRR